MISWRYWEYDGVDHDGYDNVLFGVKINTS